MFKKSQARIGHKRRAAARIGAALLVSANLLTAPLWAQDMSSFMPGAYLHDLCDAQEDGCLFYILGVIDANERMRSFGDDPGYCLPAGVTSGQLRDIVARYFRDRPDEHQYATASTIATALYAIYPCP